MVTGVYSVLDVKAKSFNQLLFFANDDMCRRAMAQRGPEDSDAMRWPDEFVMYQVGVFDSDNGVLSGVAAPRLVASFGEFHKKG